MNPKNKGKPNILWICPDMLRYDAIHALGNPYIRTPNIDSLVDEGVVFTRAYCQNTLCTPSRASFLTGRYPFATGVVGCGNEYFPSDEKLVTKTLAEAGYDCGLVGKLHLSAIFQPPLNTADGSTYKKAARVELRPDDGYRIFHWNHDPIKDWGESDGYHRWLDDQGVDWPQLRKEGNIPGSLHQSTWCAEQAIEFIEKESKSPWMLSVNTFHPHTPFDVTADAVRRFDIDSLPGPLFRETDLVTQNEYLKDVDFGSPPAAVRPEDFKVDRLQSSQGVDLSSLPGDREKVFQAAHWACVEQVDRQIGRILDSLKTSGQWEDTVVIFHSDHGHPFGDHGLLGHAGCRFYDFLTHVPLLFSWPGQFRKGLRAEGLVELIDIVPTVLDLLGLAIPENIHGRSLLSVLTGQAEPGRIKEGVRCEYYFSFDDFTGNWNGTYGTMYRDERYKLCIYHGLDVGELYDMDNDPHEFENLWDSPAHSDIKHRLIKRCFDRCMLTIDRGPRRIASA